MNKKQYLFIAVYTLTISFMIYAENRLIIESVLIEGTKRTKDIVILNELAFNKGEYFNKDELNNAIKKSNKFLYDLQILSDIIISYKEVRGKWEIIIYAQDRWTFFPIVFPGYDNFSGISFTASLSDNNLFGYNKKLGIGGKYNKYDSYINLQYSDNKIFNCKLMSFTTSFLYKYYKDFKYSNESIDQEGQIVYQSQNYKVHNYSELAYNLSIQKNIIPNIYSEIFYIGKDVEKNEISEPTENELFWLTGIGVYIGKIYHNGYIKQGMRTSVWAGISPFYYKNNLMNIGIENKWFGNPFDNSKISLINKSLLGYRIKMFMNNNYEYQFYSHRDIRGINIGEVQGNYGFLVNMEYKQFLFNIPWSANIDVYLPFFIDIGYATYWDNNFDPIEIKYIVGVGIVLFPEKINTILRLNFAININKIKQNIPGWFFFSINLGELLS